MNRYRPFGTGTIEFNKKELKLPSFIERLNIFSAIVSIGYMRCNCIDWLYEFVFDSYHVVSLFDGFII